MKPLVCNIDSAFDWSVDVRQLWEQLGWEAIRQALAPQISVESWIKRRDELALIGLVSNLVIEQSYIVSQWEEERDESREAASQLERDWRERQLGRRSHERESNRRPSRFMGEEPFFRSPRIAKGGVTECYGIYVSDARTFLSDMGLLDKIPSATHAPAVFLCPERILEVYSIILSVGENLRHALTLFSNPALVSLRMTMLHEIGHHFFPVHRANAGRFLSEGLANLFCYCGADQDQQSWLLYKTWFLQPPEYSAYRALDVLCDADEDCKAAVAECFNGTVNGWISFPPKDSSRLERAFGASLNMALAVDAPPCNGLGNELRKLASEQNRWFLRWDENHLFHRFHRDDQGHLPADFILDLYHKNDLGSWATRPELPCQIWGRWAYGDEVRWPHNCIEITEADADKWFAYYALTEDTPLASVICGKLVAVVKANAAVVRRPALRLALDRAIAVATNDQAMWFDRVPAIQLLEACSEVGAIPALEAIAAVSEWGDVHEAAAKALASLRAGPTNHPGD